jgi:hypothetical protein
MELDDIIASPIVLIASPLERSTWSIVFITMELDDIIASPIVLITSPLERNTWSIVPKHMIDLVKHAVTRLAKKRSLGYSLQGFMYFHLKIFFFV